MSKCGLLLFVYNTIDVLKICKENNGSNQSDPAKGDAYAYGYFCCRTGRKGACILKLTAKILNVASTIIPLAIASVLGILLLCNIPVFHGREFYFLPELRYAYIPFALLYVVFIIWMGWMINKFFSKQWLVISVLLIFFVSLIPRVVLISLFKQQIIPFSDFLWSWDVAQGAREGHSFIVHLPFPAYQTWAFVEYLLTRVLPKDYSSILYFNAVMDSLIAVMIMILSTKIARDRSVAVLAGLFYGLFPSAVFYCTVGTPELIAIFLNLIGILLLIDCLDEKWHFARLAIAGVSFGLASSLKSFSIVIIIAFVLVGLLTVRKKITRQMLSFLILVATYCVTKQLVLLVTSSWLETNLSNYSSGVIYHQLLVGLNTEGEGQIHLGTISRGFWNTFMENGCDATGAGAYAKRLLIQDWKNHYTQIPNLLLRKIVWAWQDDLIPLHYFLNVEGLTETAHQSLFSAIRYAVPCVSQVMYVGFAVTGCGCILNHFDQSKKENNRSLFVSVIILGFFCLLLIIEAQSRYKCLVLPLIVLQSSRGYDMIKKRMLKRKFSPNGSRKNVSDT